LAAGAESFVTVLFTEKIGMGHLPVGPRCQL